MGTSRIDPNRNIRARPYLVGLQSEHSDRRYQDPVDENTYPKRFGYGNVRVILDGPMEIEVSTRHKRLVFGAAARLPHAPRRDQYGGIPALRREEDDVGLGLVVCHRGGSYGGTRRNWCG